MTTLHRLIIIVLCAGGVCVHAQPRISMQNEMDWGTVVPMGSPTSKQTVSAKIPVRNTGDSVLVISSVRVQCGCTSAPLADTVLDPGEETIMDLKVDLPKGAGLLQKYVTVYSNDPAGSHVLRLKVNVERPLLLGSSFLAFDRGIVGKPVRAVMSVTLNADTTATVSIRPVSAHLVVTTPQPVTLTKGTTVEFELLYTPQATGMFQVQAVLSSSLPGYEAVELSGYGTATTESAK
jgi:hypothetical protein